MENSKDDPSAPGADPQTLAKELLQALLGDDYSEQPIDWSHSKTFSEMLMISELEADIGLTIGFFEELLDEPNDWSFLIKLHALMEAAVGQLLLAHFADDRLGAFIDRLEMSNSRTGKTALAAAIGRMDKTVRSYIQKLSEISSSFRPNASMTSPRLRSIVFGIVCVFVSFKTALCLGAKESRHVKLGKSEEGLYNLLNLHQIFATLVFDLNRRLAVWIGASYCLHQINNGVELAKLDRELIKKLEVFAERLAATAE